MSRLRLLIVEDEPPLLEYYRQLLKHPDLQNRFEVLIVRDAESALKSLARHPPDIAILDWGLPGKSGMEVLQAIREHPKARAAQVFVVTAFAAKDREVEALESGADDYLAKPFYPEVLVTRLLNLARRLESAETVLVGGETEVVELEDLRLEMPLGFLRSGKSKIQLHRKEAELLRIFLKRPNMIHASEYLWDNVWGYSSANSRHTLHVTLSNLRKRLNPRWSRRLESVKDQGYILRSGTG